MLPIIFWILVFAAGAWALYTGLTTPAEPSVADSRDGARAPESVPPADPSRSEDSRAA